MGNALIGGLAPCGIPATWGHVYFMKREGTPVLGLPFMWVFLPFVFLLLALVYRTAMAIWRAAKGEVPEKLSQRKFLLLVNLMFLVLDCFLDLSVLLLVFVPILLRAAKLLGVDLVHFGALVVLDMMIGLIHPSFGMLLCASKALTVIPIGEMMREGWPFLLMLLALLLATTFFPQIVLWLPQTMGYGTK